ncbi:MAG: prepilin-type N-terminal cleavage/methylation domain-containing protein [Synergistaceae bacterium]|nr:prepilin-type N-terminal cleavage/methylation domain-containing protein [Synergistaceae bacterium]MBQ6971959.1 prepilin-type N-terminal cleavage/methylation domain-containing protein [Synergistaceae bacterium]
MDSKRHGFTLIEILIVIVVIGVLAAMMMFSSTEAEKSARAQNIINNFNQIQKAVQSWYADNMHRITTDGMDGSYVKYRIYDTNGKTKLAFKEFVQKRSGEIMKYLGNNPSIKLTGKEDKTMKAGDYLLIDFHYKYWYVCYDTGTDKGLQSRLAGRASSMELRGFQDDKITNNVVTNKNYTGGRYVCMSILDLDK